MHLPKHLHSQPRMHSVHIYHNWYDRTECPACMHAVSAICLWTTVLIYNTYRYPEQGMADRLLRVHIQSPAGLWAWVTLNYNTMLSLGAAMG